MYAVKNCSKFYGFTMQRSIERAASRGEEKIFWMEFTHDKPAVIYGEHGIDFNREYCRQNKIGIAPVGTSGGTIVHQQGNLTFIFLSHKNTGCTFNKQLQETIADYLRTKGLNAQVTGNDIILDGNKKVSGAGKMKRKNMWAHGLFIAMNSAENLVKNICYKPMKKIPAGLSDYGVNKEAILNAALNFCNQYEGD